MATTESKMNVVDNIIAWESGELSADDTVNFFSQLIKDGTINHLQGCYGRTARGLMQAGYIAPNGDVRELPSERE